MACGVGADFAWRWMKSQGWSDGDGLGKLRQGRKNALKPRLKFDSHGLGHDRAEEFEFHWWDHVFTSAVKGIKVNNDENGEITVQFKADRSEISAKKLRRRMQKEMKSQLYSRFVKAGTLTGSELLSENNESEVTEVKDLSKIKTLSDEDLVKACGGRTAHKGARHGQKMSAKLKRVEEAELAFIASVQAKQKEKEEKKNKKLLDQKPAESSLKTSAKTEIKSENLQKPLENLPNPQEISTEVKEKKSKKRKSEVLSEVTEVNKVTSNDVEVEDEVKKSKKKRKKDHEVEGEVICDNDSNDNYVKKDKKKRKKENAESSPEVDITCDDMQIVETENENTVKKKKKKKDKDKKEIETEQQVVQNNVPQDIEEVQQESADKIGKKKKKSKKSKHD